MKKTEQKSASAPPVTISTTRVAWPTAVEMSIERWVDTNEVIFA